MRERDATLKEISIKFGISKRRVCRILKDKRLRKPGRKPVAIDEDVKNLILRLRRRGIQSIGFMCTCCLRESMHHDTEMEDDKRA